MISYRQHKDDNMNKTFKEAEKRGKLITIYLFKQHLKWLKSAPKGYKYVQGIHDEYILVKNTGEPQ